MIPSLIQERPLYFLPSLAKKVGGVNEALILQQIYHWLVSQDDVLLHEGRHWLKDTDKRCLGLFNMWDEETIRLIIQNLLDAGYLIPISIKSLDSEIVTIYSKIVTIDYTRFGVSDDEAQYQERVRKVCRYMLEMWNAYPAFASNQIECLTATEQDALIEFLVNYLITEGVTWEEYCEAVHQSVISDKGVYLAWEWAIQPKNALPIIKSALSHKPYTIEEKSPEDYLKDIRQASFKNEFQEDWLKVWATIAADIGQGECSILLGGSSIIALTAEKLVLQVCNDFARDYILAFMMTDLANAVNKIFPTVSIIEVQTGSLAKQTNI